MTPTTHKYEINFLETILLSLLLHASLFIIIPRMNLNEIVIPEMMNVEINLTRPQMPEEKEEIKKVEPPKEKVQPEVKKPEPIKDIKPKVEESPSELKEKVEEVIEPIPENTVKNIPEPLKEKQASQPSPEAVKVASDSYTGQLTRAIAKQKKYPKIAQMRQWQGEVVLNVEIDPNGNLVKTDILEKSRYKILDEEAINMVKRAAPFPKPPEELQSRNFTVLVPISFKLE